MCKFLLWLARFFVSLVWTICFQKRPRPAPVPLSPPPDPNPPAAGSLRDGHELSDAKPKVIAAFAAGLFLVIFATMAALGWMYTRLYAKTSAMPVPMIQESFKDAPHAQTSIEGDWQAIDAEAHRRLDGYGWTDGTNRSVRIPVARAMELIAREGLPARNGPSPAFPPPDQEPLPVSESEKTQAAANSHVP